MEDSFQARVDKVFGSLVSTPSPSPLSSLWSLTDQEIAKKEWNGDKHDDDSDEGFFDKPSQGQIRNTKFTVFGELQDHEGPDPDGFNDISNDNKRRKKHNLHSTDDEDFDIRSSIGLDCTLDFEEEEDVYDKVAIGKENSVGDRLYMRDIVGIDDNPHHELPSSFNNVARDHRANHVAAKLRLKEDAETAGNFDSLKLSDVAAVAAADRIDNNRVTPKPILKKKKKKRERREQGGKSPTKRVRFQEEFNVTHKDPQGEESAAVEKGGTTTSQEGEDKLAPAEVKAQGSGLLKDSTDGLVEASTSYYSIPDYLRNPSRYTRYTLDSSDDMDEESNRRACMDFFNQLKRPNCIEHSESLVVVSSPKMLIFTPPKKKESETSSIIVTKDNNNNNEEEEEEELNKQNVADNISKDKKLLAFAAGDVDSGICPMEEDKQQPDILVDKSSCALKTGRQYRSRTIVNCKDE